MDKDEEVFLDAEEEITPRRTGRKRRSTAGSTTPAAVKRPKTKDKMPTKHSPKSGTSRQVDPKAAGAGVAGVSGGAGVGFDQDAFWNKMGGMLGGLESRMKMETDEVKEQLGVAVNTLGDLGMRVERAEKRLDGLAEEVNSLVDKKLAGLPAPEVAMDRDGAGTSYASALLRVSPGAGKLESPGPATALNRKENAYWQCRRALRLRPVGKGEIIKAVKNYMSEHLGLTDEFIESLGHFKAVRVPAGPSAKVQGEAVVTFSSTEARDAVKSSARNLAGKGQDFGVRLEVPNHLKSSLSALQAASYEIKQKHSQARRNVLFNDDCMDLVLDFCLEEGKAWKRMTSSQAKQMKKKITSSRDRLTLDDEELNRLLDGGTSEDEEEEEITLE